MILSKKLYLKRGFLTNCWLVLRHAFLNLTTLFKRSSLESSQSRPLGLPILTLKQDSTLQCNACGLCIAHCPTNALDLSATDTGVVVDFRLDVLRCVTCGLCQEVCPVDAIRMGREVAHANHAEANWVMDAKELSKNGALSRLS